MFKKALISILFLVGPWAGVWADTFQHTSKAITYHGYATSVMKDGKNVVITEEQGPVELNLANYTIEWNTQGRANHVAVLKIDDVIALEHATVAFEKAIVEEADKGPLMILIEIDTPGGRVDLCKRLCAAITGARYCKTVAYIHGGENGGAYSAGAAVSLACNDIYMVPGVSMGAATMILAEQGKATDMKAAFGEAVGEKYNSAWRSYLASLAEEHNRSGALAKAMADKDIVVVEVKRADQSLFIEPQDQKPGDTLVRTVCAKGELLTLSANEAVACQIATGLADSRQALLAALGVPNATLIESTRLREADEEFEKVARRFQKLNEVLDLKFQALSAKYEAQSLTIGQALRDYRAIIHQTEYLLKLKRGYPDIPYEEEAIISFLNRQKAQYEAIKAMR